MSPLSLNQIVILYAWFPLAALLFFFLLIGRFYQKFSGEPTRFRLFVAPMILFGAAAVRYSSINAISGDALGDVLYAGAGVVLLGLCLHLYRRMLYRRGATAD